MNKENWSYDDLTEEDLKTIATFRKFVEDILGVNSVMGGVGIAGFTSEIITKCGLRIQINAPWFTKEEHEEIKRDHLQSDFLPEEGVKKDGED
jgi:hypothetical protein